jgi:hypothetical protein
MKTLRSVALAFTLYIFSLSAQAMSIKYDVTYSDVGFGAGTGEFFWDGGTTAMTGFVWDFGAGQTGGLLDTILAGILFSGTVGAGLFELITGQDVSPDIPTIGGIRFGGGFTPTTSFPANAIIFDATSKYRIENGAGVSPVGSVTATVASVPEPGTLGLALIGLAGLGFSRKRKQRQAAAV